MLITSCGSSLLVQREDGAKRIPTESAFWHELKTTLNDWHSHDLIKKVMSKDGHMVGGSTYPYYLRDRKWRYCIHDGRYCLRELHKDYNSGAEVRLDVVVWDGDNLSIANESIKEKPCT